ncbi:MAG: hypothetical protein WKF63_00575 [Thermomicrobiales bacterium]
MAGIPRIPVSYVVALMVTIIFGQGDRARAHDGGVDVVNQDDPSALSDTKARASSHAIWDT